MARVGHRPERVWISVHRIVYLARTLNLWVSVLVTVCVRPWKVL
jgi:hypothetical protein